MPDDERIKRGIDDSLIRLSIGIENAEDIIKDIEQALNQAKIKQKTASDINNPMPFCIIS